MPAIVFLQGAFELVGLGGFIAGYFVDSWWLMMIGGCMVVLDDVFSMSTGVLNPLFPVFLAVCLAIAFSPWYVGVFWASAAFQVFGIPHAVIKVVMPRTVAAQYRRS